MRLCSTSTGCAATWAITPGKGLHPHEVYLTLQMPLDPEACLLEYVGPGGCQSAPLPCCPVGLLTHDGTGVQDSKALYTAIKQILRNTCCEPESG